MTLSWEDQPGLKSEMDRLQAFQNRFAKRILGNKISSSEALNSLQWIPLAERRFAHRCSAVQNAIKGEIPEHLETFTTTLRDLRGHNTRNSYLPRIPHTKTQCGKIATYYRYISDWSTLSNFLRKPMPRKIFKRDLKKFLRAKYRSLQIFAHFPAFK